MPLFVKLFLLAACIFRVGTLVVSVRNERRLKANGAREYGRTNSLVLGYLHTAIYVGALIEGFRRNAHFDAVTAVGMVLYIIGAIGLVIVIQTLGRIWSLKLLIASDHILITHPLFRVMKHPNYFLGVLPELFGFVLILHAWLTLAIGLPLYLISLAVRIREEEVVMKQEFATY